MLVIKCSICIWSVSCHSHCYIMHLSKIGVCPWLYRKICEIFSLRLSVTHRHKLIISLCLYFSHSLSLCLSHTHTLSLHLTLYISIFHSISQKHTLSLHISITLIFFSLSNSSSNTNSLSLRKCRIKEDAISIKWREKQIVNIATHYVWEISKKSRNFKEIASRTEP